MVHAARSSAVIGLMTSVLLAGCPSSGPNPRPVSNTAGTPAASASTPAETQPKTEPAPSTPSGDPTIPPEDARPAVKALWRGIEGVDGGNADAMAEVMDESGRWYPPGGDSDSVGVADLRRAMAPWASPEVQLDLRRVIDLGGSPFIAQLSAASEGGRKRYEMALVVETTDDRVQTVRHYGDPLGPVRLGPAAVDPLDLGPVGAVPFEGGRPTAANVEITRTLTEALERRDEDAALALLSPAVILHDIRGRKSRTGPGDFAAAYRADLGSTGHLTIAHHYAGTQYVVIEGSLHGHEADDSGQEHGFLDIHRLQDGKIAETWHYLNRRVRPRPSDQGTPLDPSAHRHPTREGKTPAGE